VLFDELFDDSCIEWLVDEVFDVWVCEYIEFFVFVGE